MSLFKLNSEKTMKFLDETSNTSDGLYRPSLDKALNKRDGYKAIIRYLPNVIDETGETGEAAIERLMTYVKMTDPQHKGLSGYYDSPKNFDEDCDLTTTYFALKNSGNPVLVDRSKNLNKITKFYSYVYIVEDKNQPELEGKILIYQYGWKIKEKIKAEWRAENPERSKCDIFDLAIGKDFELLVKEVGGYTNYDSSMFLRNSPIAINGKEMPTEDVDGITMIAENVQEKILKFILSKDVDLVDFEPKRLTDTERGKIQKIIAYLSGDETSNMFDSASESNADVSAEDIFAGNNSDMTEDVVTSTTTDETVTTTDANEDPFGDLENVEVSEEEDPFKDM